MTESKKKFRTIWVAVAIFCFTISASSPAFSSDETVVKDGQPAIVKVFGCPVGLESDFKYGKCGVYPGILPMSTFEMSPGEKFIIKVIGDDDIVIQCLGTEGMKVSRD
jgi:hypothetical protein